MKHKILTVDDSITIRTIIKEMLSTYDCAIIEATNGKEGLLAAKKEHPTLILLDIDLPGMNGLELLMNLRNLDQFKSTPVFMLTSKCNYKNVRYANELGVKEFISKPFKRAELIQRIMNVMPLTRLKCSSSDLI